MPPPGVEFDDVQKSASEVVPIDKLSVVITMVLAAVILHEQFTPRSIFGCVLIGAGTLLMIL